jgi:hypothetical protein
MPNPPGSQTSEAARREAERQGRRQRKELLGALIGCRERWPRPRRVGGRALEGQRQEGIGRVRVFGLARHGFLGGEEL